MTFHPFKILSEKQAYRDSEKRVYTVVEAETTLDESSWKDIAERGSIEQIASYLDKRMLDSVNISFLTSRVVTSKDLFDSVTAYLSRRGYFDASIWSASFDHCHVTRMEEFLLSTEYGSSIGPLRCHTPFHVEGFGQSQGVDISQRGNGVAGSLSLETSYLPQVDLEPLLINKSLWNTASNVDNTHLKELYARVLFAMTLSPPHLLHAMEIFTVAYYLTLQNRYEVAREVLSEVWKKHGCEASTIPSLVERVQTSTAVTSIPLLQVCYLFTYLQLILDAEEGGKKAAADFVHIFSSSIPLSSEWGAKVEAVKEVVKAFDGGVSSRAGEAEEGQQKNSRRNEAGKEGTAGMEDSEGDTIMHDATTPLFELDVEGTVPTIRHRNIGSVTVNIYRVDIEHLFSEDPFAKNVTSTEDLERKTAEKVEKVGEVDHSGQHDSAEVEGEEEGECARACVSTDYRSVSKPVSSTSLPFVSANRSFALKLGEGGEGGVDYGSVIATPLPITEDFGHYYLEVTGTPTTETAAGSSTTFRRVTFRQPASFSVSALHVRGVISVTTSKEGWGERNPPVRGAYVKVYTEMKGSGKVSFFKDGYTNVFGEFDFVSSNDDAMENAERVAILVVCEGRGAKAFVTLPPLFEQDEY
uniref:Uncharacterized protein n=1 Tax=Palpitomonas bilix TaxID=652834 RepID=A0A7S3LVU4_9EUKA